MRSANRIERHQLADDGLIPNNPRLPLLLYPGAVEASSVELPSTIETLFGRNGWPTAWRNGVYAFPHYHSVCHEALGIARGRARLRLGGAAGFEVEVAQGDVLVLPAGTGHQNLGAGLGFLVVGAYPKGSEYDLCRGAPGERPATLNRIATVPVPPTDPVFGHVGGVAGLWR